MDELAITEQQAKEYLQSIPAKNTRARRQRQIGAPLDFLIEVRASTVGVGPLLVALLIYRRVSICGSRTVTLPRAELAKLDVGREMKRLALIRLASAGLIRIERALPGHLRSVTLLWKPQPTHRHDGGDPANLTVPSGF